MVEGFDLKDPGNIQTQWWVLEVRNAVNLKKESNEGWFSQGTPEAADGYQHAKHVARQVVMEGKTWILRETMEETTVALEEMLTNHLVPRTGVKVIHQHFVQCKWVAVDLGTVNWGYYWVAEGIGGSPQSH